MRIVLGALFAAALASAQTLSLPAGLPASPTSVVLEITGYTGSCEVILSKSADLSNPIAADHEDDVVAEDDTYSLVLQRLTPDTAYWVRVENCAGTSNTVVFKTPTLPNGTNQTQYGGFDDEEWGNWNLFSNQPFDWTDLTKEYLDPRSGVRMRPLPFSYRSARTGGTSGGSNNFAHCDGGSGWTNPTNICSGTNATVANTNPLNVYINQAAEPGNALDPYSFYYYLHDIGVVPQCGSSGGSVDADRTISVQIRKHGTLVGDPVTFVCADGAAAPVGSGSDDPDEAHPAAFPGPAYPGWCSGGCTEPLIRIEDQMTYGSVTVSSSTLTIASPNKTAYFSHALVAGDKVYLEGPSNCTNGLYTVATNINAASITVTSPPGNGCTTFRAYGFNLEITKANGTGSIELGLTYKLAGAVPLGMHPLGDKCADVVATAGDGKTGHVCVFTAMPTGSFLLAFVAEDGTIRVISDRESTNSQSLWFDDEDPKVFYQAANSSGNHIVNKLTYTGDFTENLYRGYDCQFNFGCPAYDDHMTVENIMATPGNLQAQLTADWPAYDASVYGNFAVGSGGFLGATSKHAVFNKWFPNGTQDVGPVWLSTVDLDTGEVDHLCNTLTGEGCPAFRYAAFHAGIPFYALGDLFFFSGSPLTASNTSVVAGGPFRGVIDRVLRSGSWSSDTSLPWAPDSSYDRTCPANDYGATECVTVRMNEGFCNIAAGATELMNFPTCPWNGSYSQPVTWQVGDLLIDVAKEPDGERFRILDIDDEGGGKFRVVLMRNAVWDYCSKSPWHGVENTSSAASDAQFTHSNGFVVEASPGNWNGCRNIVALWDLTEDEIKSIGRDGALHFELGKNAGGTINFVQQARSFHRIAFDDLQTLPAPWITTDTGFAGVGNGIGTNNAYQSYTDQSSWACGAPCYNFAIDTNALVPGSFQSTSSGVSRTLTAVTGDIYRINKIGSGTQSLAGYKLSPMVGWAGQHQLRDISGPGSDITADPYTMCFVAVAEECYTGSTAGQIYVNVPHAYNPSGSCLFINWANVPCILMGNHFPQGGIRQFGINAEDADGEFSRFISMGFCSVGRQTAYTHAILYPNGQMILQQGACIIDGMMPMGALIFLPSRPAAGSDPEYLDVTVAVPAGSAYAEIRAGYNSDLECMPRAEACVPGDPFKFTHESRTLASCADGCNIDFSVAKERLLYYQVWRGDMADGSDAAPDGDIQFLGISSGLVSARGPSGKVRISGKVVTF